MKCYLASGWFNEKQFADVQNIKQKLTEANIDFYSPMDEIICPKNANTEEQESVFRENVKHIKEADFMVANTRDKDMGTIFECGVAFECNKPIVYYCEGLKGNFNLMLSRSGSCVATSLEKLAEHLANINKDINYKSEYEGVIE